MKCLINALIGLIFSFAVDMASAAAEPTSNSASPVIRTAVNSPKDRSCRAAYRDLFAQGSVSIRVVFGYKDTRPARFVGDRHERLAFVQRILRPCAASSPDQACGFIRDNDNADLFSKTIPGIDGKPVRVELFVASSSVSSDDEANRANPFQKWQSSYAQKAYLGGIDKADVVFYNGHSRFGGGPDFEPPHLAANGEVDQKLYQSKRPGLNATIKTLSVRARANDRTDLKVLGLFSCASSQHFAAEIVAGSKAAYISSRALVYYADAIENSLSALSALLEMRCEKDFNRSLRSQTPESGSQLLGLFKEH